MTDRRFAQVDVFATTPLSGNPVAVVLDGDGLADHEMARFAAWTNLSETTFALPPTEPSADYRLRIFTPGAELPFAGHPTLGSAHAWLEAGGTPKRGDTIVQECSAGLVSIRRAIDRHGVPALAFAAPPLVRNGPIDDGEVARIAEMLRIPRTAIAAHHWVDNGPGWAAVMLDSAEAVLALEPDFAGLEQHMLGVIGRHAPGGEAQFEVRGFAGLVGVREDPVTGSLNAGLAQWMVGAGLAPTSYVVAQGARAGRAGHVTIDAADGQIWVGGVSTTRIYGTVDL